jgi:hypothetical protein
MKRVIMISYYFPPLVGIASERAAAFARHLPTAGWEPTVIAPREGFFHRVSIGGQTATSVVRTTNPELSRLLRTGFSVATRAVRPDDDTVLPVGTSSVAARLRRLARGALYVPDAQLGWVPFAGQAAARELTRSPERAVLFSSSVPFSAHLAAMWARSRVGRVPWVAEFRDPWSEAHPSLLPASALRRRIDRSLHRRILRDATRIVVTSPGFRDLLLETFPELDPARVDVVMNGFEPAPVGSPPSPSERLRIVYAGTVAPGEDVGPFLAALDHIHEERPGRLHLTVVGSPEPWRRMRGEAPWLDLRGMRTPEEARGFMHNASAVFLLQSHEAYALTLPGKLWEYVGARRPILAAVPGSWPMVDLLRAHADLRLAPNTESGLSAELERLLAEHETGRLQPPRVSEEAVRPLERRVQAVRMAAVFESAAAS